MNGYFSSIDFDFNTAIYPFDFAGDCHCPTFSKDGELIKKGFFFELQPGLGYQVLKRLRTDPDDPAKLPIRSKNIVFKLGGAAGLDMGFSEHFTVTPMLSMTMLTPKNGTGCITMVRKENWTITYTSVLVYVLVIALTINNNAYNIPTSLSRHWSQHLRSV